MFNITHLPVLQFIHKVDLPPALILLILIVPMLPNIWCIMHAYRSVFANPVERIAWMMVGVFFPFIGGIIYIIFGVRRSTKRSNVINNQDQN